MPTRRLASFILGMWLGGSFMTFVVTWNFASVDRLLNAPEPAAAKTFQALARETARILRQQVAQQDRLYFEVWEWVQIALGIALVVTLYYASNGNPWVLGFSVAMLILVIFVRVVVTPEIIRGQETVRAAAIARQSRMDSAGTGRVVPPPARQEFWRFHPSYTIIEIIKLAIALGLSGYLFWTRAKRKIRVRRRSKGAVTPARPAHE